jgi:universal stress protein A
MSAAKILFATDYSSASRDALNYGASLARERGATLLITHVSRLEEYPVGELFDEEPRPSDAELEELIAITVPDPRVHCEHRLLHGDPARQIVELAKQENVETIVMGTHGRSGLGRLVTGSVAEAVLREAPCAVIAVRPAALVPVA